MSGWRSSSPITRRRQRKPSRLPVRLRLEKGPHAGVARAELLRRAQAMLAFLQLEKTELSIVLTDDLQIQKLNKDYRGKDRPTDVLAFAMREGDFARLAGDLLGDVIVSVPTARKQALRRKWPALDEVTMLVAHGLLHLLGWDHDTAAKDARMRAETDRLCAAAAAPRAAPPARASRRPAPVSVKGESPSGSRSRSSRKRQARRA
jgi:probable rRNA maturation factor